MAGSTTRNWWQYAKWVRLIGRSFIINPPSALERTACETFIKYFWDNATMTGTRQWLSPELNFRAIAAGDEYLGDVAVEPDAFDRKVIVFIGRDLNKIPMTEGEADAIDALIAATGNRRYNQAP